LDRRPRLDTSTQFARASRRKSGWRRSFQAAHDAEVAEIKRLEAEVVRLKEEVRKAEAAKPKP
jgi:hypothetical protein